MGEFDLVALIRERIAHSRNDVALGIGDDAALVKAPAGQQLAACTDTLVAGMHFPLGTAPEDIGWKSLAVNLSDLAAMGAMPAWAMLALTMPEADEKFVKLFADGFAELARKHDVALIGGDTTQGPLSITVSAFGFVPTAIHGEELHGRALLRSAARVHDAVFVTGTLGDAAAALELLRDPGFPAPDPERRQAHRELIVRLNRPEPRVAAGLALRGFASACIDISDGLLADLGHVCEASGVGAEVDADALPTSAALRGTFAPDRRRNFASSGGDDYELCFTAREADARRIAEALSRADCVVTRIGRVVAEPGVRARDAEGNVLELPRRGWQHFAS